MTVRFHIGAPTRTATGWQCIYSRPAPGMCGGCATGATAESARDAAALAFIGRWLRERGRSG